MMLLDLPAELVQDIIHYIPSVGDKCQLLQTCRQLNHFLCTHVACWPNLDFSPYNELNNSTLLTFLTNCHILLYITDGDPLNITLSRLDLSGCRNLSQSMVVALSKSFSHLEELCLNGYRLNSPAYVIKKGDGCFEQQRDHVYQIPPSLTRTMTTYSPKKNMNNQLNIPYILLSNILLQVPNITKLSIQHQDLSPIILLTNRPYFSEFNHISHLDISSCIIDQPGIQSMLREVGNQLKSLKMLNIDLNSLTWLSISQFGKNITCLHVSCIETSLICFQIRHTLSNLKYLSDFRLTGMHDGLMDLLTEKLNWNLLKRLDLSPKMNIYSNYATTEYDLLISDVGLNHISLCHQLVELRLCFPTVTTFNQAFFKSIQQLEIFELRQKGDKVNCLKGLEYLINLKELFIYSVFISKDCISTISNSPLLRHVTISNGGVEIEDLEAQRYILNHCPRLKSFYLGQLNQVLTSHPRWSCKELKHQQHCQNVLFSKNNVQ